VTKTRDQLEGKTMTEQRKRRGGVIIAPDHHTYGLIGLLATPVRDQLDLVFYHHPYQIDLDTPHDFIIVLSLNDLRTVIKFYDAKRLDLPLIVHIDAPEVVECTRYAILFPGVNIHPVAQVALDAEPGVTLQVNTFAQILDLLHDEVETSSEIPSESKTESLKKEDAQT
jgi:hypothetical protein